MRSFGKETSVKAAAQQISPRIHSMPFTEPKRRSSRKYESVRLIAGQDLGAARVLSFHCLRTQGPRPDLAQ